MAFMIPEAEPAAPPAAADVPAAAADAALCEACAAMNCVDALRKDETFSKVSRIFNVVTIN